MSIESSLSISPTSGPLYLAGGGRINRCTVDGSGQLRVTHLGLLDEVTLGNELELVMEPGSALTAFNGLTLNGTAVIESSDGLHTTLQFTGSQTLGGSGEIVFRKGVFNSTISVRPTNDEDVLTIGSGIEIRSDTTGGTVGHEQRGLINEGTIVANGQTIIVTGNNWSNTGLLKATNGGLLRLIGAAHNETGGHIVVDSNVILTGGATLTNKIGGMVSGSGVLNAASGTFMNQGVVAPGMSSTGVLDVTGDFTQTSSGDLIIEIAGSTTPGQDFDQLAVSGQAVLAGGLVVDLINGFTPMPGNVIPVLTADEVVGGFTDYTGDVFTVDANLALVPVVDQDADEVIVVVTVPGDTNLDLKVDATDLNTVALNWQQSVAGWRDADFNNDGFVDAGDLNALALNWQFGVVTGAGSVSVSIDDAFAEALAATNIPEPGCLAVIVLGSLATIRSRSLVTG